MRKMFKTRAFRRLRKSKDATNSIKVLKENATKENNTKNIKKTENTHTQKSIQITVRQTGTKDRRVTAQHEQDAVRLGLSDRQSL